MKKIVIIFTVFFTNNAFALYTENIPNACQTNNLNMHAIYQSDVYTCNSGFFLPASSNTCSPCPTGYTCPGGVYIADIIHAQGLYIGNNSFISDNLNNVCFVDYPNIMRAVYKPVVYTCDEGFFLPAKTNGCRACPSGYLCPGGTFYADTKRAQGLKITTTPVVTTTNNTCSINIKRMYAVFRSVEESTINISWDNNGDISYTSCVLGNTFELPTPPTRVGYTFTGWKVKASD